MKYSSVTSGIILDNAAQQIISQLRSRAKKTFPSRKIIFRPNHVIADVFWLPNYQLWFAAISMADHYWIPIGSEEPAGSKPLRILFELNIPRKANHGRAGIILTDGRGSLFLAHTGRVGGGVPKINRKEFLKFRGPLKADTATYDDTKAAIMIAAIGDTNLPNQLAHFAREVAAFKKAAREQNSAPIQMSQAVPFQPKASGRATRKAQTEQQVELLHDIVCEAINKRIPSPGGYADKARDLFTLKPDGSMAVLYEVKTDKNTTAIYTAVGQLLVNGRAHGGAKRLVLVIPGKPDHRTQNVLADLGITILSYRWSGAKPILPAECFTGVQ